jgi:hypothetical protein
MVLFGNISQVQKMGKGAGHGQRMSDGQGAEGLLQTRKISLVSLPGTLRHGANRFDRLKNVLSHVRAQGLPKKLAKQTDIITQGLMRIGSHG